MSSAVGREGGRAGGRREGEGTRGVAIDRNRIHTAPSIYWRIIIATAKAKAKARATVVAGDASGGRGGHRGVEWLPADCQDRNSTTGLQNPIPRDRHSSKSQTLLSGCLYSNSKAFVAAPHEGSVI